MSLRQRQPEAGAAAVADHGVADLLEGLHHALEIGGGNADAGVGDGNADPSAALSRHDHRDAAAGLGEA
jgi:hypothetical protein